VHLAIDPGEFAVTAEDGGGVVINARGSPFKQGSDQRDLEFLRHLAQPLCGRTGNGFGEGEQCSVLTLAKILRLEEFREANELRTLFCGLAHVRNRAIHILFRVGRARHLRDSDNEIPFSQR
jgi:hypothetical protein